MQQPPEYSDQYVPEPFARSEELRCRVAVVTGVGRRRGIGSAVCRALAARGADVVLSYWKAYDRGMPWESDEDEPARLLEKLKGAGVNAEAVSTRGGYEELDAGTIDAHHAVNVRAMALLSVHFARRYPGGPGGRIVNFSSGQFLGPMEDELAYAMTKGAIEAFTLSLAAGVGHRGITVNAVNPGPTDTGWIPDDLRGELRPKFPAGRIGQPEDAARLVAFLASDEAAWITGQTINSEGGYVRK